MRTRARNFSSPRCRDSTNSAEKRPMYDFSGSGGIMTPANADESCACNHSKSEYRRCTTKTRTEEENTLVVTLNTVYADMPSPTLVGSDTDTSTRPRPRADESLSLPLIASSSVCSVTDDDDDDDDDDDEDEDEDEDSDTKDGALIILFTAAVAAALPTVGA